MTDRMMTVDEMIEQLRHLTRAELGKLENAARKEKKGREADADAAHEQKKRAPRQPRWDD